MKNEKYVSRHYDVTLSEEVAAKLVDLSEQTGFSPDRILTMAAYSYIQDRRTKGDFILFLKRTNQFDDALQALQAGDNWELESLYSDYVQSVEEYYLLSYEEAMEELS